MDEIAIQSNESISITVNGKPRSIRAQALVTDLLEELGLQDRLVVVEHNGTILARNTFANVLVGDGDVLEIVHFVGGG